MAAVDLVQLIDLSLGAEQPSGVVNFNYLQVLLHEIVKRLALVEQNQLWQQQQIWQSGIGHQGGTQTVPPQLVKSLHGPGPVIGPSEISLPTSTVGADSTDSSPAHSQQKDDKSTPSLGTTPVPPISVAAPEQGATTTLPMVQGEVVPPTAPPGGGTPAAATVPPGTVPPPGMGPLGTIPTTGVVPPGTVLHTGVTPGTVPPGTVLHTGITPGTVPLGTGPVPPLGTSTAALTAVSGQGLTPVHTTTGLQSGIDLLGHPVGSASSIPRPPSNLRSRSNIVSAANDLSALERKIQNLETKVNSFETLPELLDRKSSDAGATPVRDMWNYTNLSKRIVSAEDGLDKASQLFDDVLGEVQNMKSQLKNMETSMAQNIDDLNNKVSASTEDLEKKLKKMESLKLASGDGSNTDALMVHITGLQEQLEALQNNSSSLQKRVESLENGLTENLANASELQDTFKSYTDQTDNILKEIQDRLSLCASEQSTNELNQKFSEMDEQLANKIKELESMLTQKVNITDLASLMPSSDGSDTANFMAKLLEMQSRLISIENELGKQPTLPTDVIEKITAMQSAIDFLTNQFRTLDTGGGGADSSRVEELGLHVAQIRERLAELDRAVSALSTAVSQSTNLVTEEDKDDKEPSPQVDIQTITDLQELVNHLQEEQERLMGTAAHLSHELEINKEHTKSLYNELDQVKATKADKEQVAIEVEEKADRTALEDKASREWVDSTFERLDKEIREAKSHLLGQEEAFRAAMSQINEDVDGKLDRMELEPLKSYFDKKISRLKTAPMMTQVEEVPTDDAAGFRKPLRFRCISCDKPVGVKPADVVPALPQIEMLPGVRSFRPYTTYELELIRKHQRLGQYSPMAIPMPSFPSTFRAAGGSHTLTRPHQRVRATPLSSVYMLESVVASSPPPPAVPLKKSGPNIHDEMDIVGHDGHIYKGRAVKPTLPGIAHSRSAGSRNRASRIQRPLSTTPTPQQTVQS